MALIALLIQAQEGQTIPPPDHGDVLYRYALGRVQEADAAEELVQETFLAALRARARFAGRSSERTWLVGILRHKIVDHLRRRGRERPAPDRDALPAAGPSDEAWDKRFDARGKWRVPPGRWGEDPSALLERAEFWETFRRCLSGLPPRLGQAFTLREMDEMSSDEVRGVLNVSAANRWVLPHRARTRLCRCLESKWFGAKAGGA